MANLHITLHPVSSGWNKVLPMTNLKSRWYCPLWEESV